MARGNARLDSYVKYALQRFAPRDWDAFQARAADMVRGRQEGSVDVTLVEAEAERPTFEPLRLDLTGQPDCFFEGEGAMPYRGQDTAKKRLLNHLRGLRHGVTQRLKALFTGSAGTGKTTLARIVARQIGGDYFELLPSQIEDKKNLDAVMEVIAAHPGCTVFVDEVHTLAHLETFLHVLHDTGPAWFPLSSGRRLVIPATISWLFATTDPGELDRKMQGAFRRRVNPEIRLEPPDADTLARIMQDSGDADGIEVTAEAADLAASRCLFPWQVKDVYNEAKLVSLGLDDPTVGVDEVTETFEIMELDEDGMLREDRDAIRALLSAPHRLATGRVVYKMSQEALCATAGIDTGTFKKRVQPKLLRLGFLSTVGGQSLTEKALKKFGTATT